METKKWTLYSFDKKNIISIIWWSIISYIPRGAFNGIVYLLITATTIPVINNKSIDYNFLWKNFYYYITAFILYFVIMIFSQTNVYYKSYEIGSNIRLSLGEKIKRLSLGFFKTNDPGDLTSRMLHDVNKAEEILSHNLSDIISGITIPIILGGFLLVIDPFVTSLMILSVIISGIFFMISKKIITVLGQRHVKVIHETSSKILEYTKAIKILKSHNMTGKSFKMLDRSMRLLKKVSFRSEVFAGIPVQIALFLLDLSYIGIILFSINRCLNNYMTIPVLFAFIVLGHYFYQPVKTAGITMILLRFAKISTERISDIFSEKEQNYIIGERLDNKKNIKFENVTFSYKKEKVLKDVSFDVSENSMTALVGESGSGKTTITNLIARFWDPDSGKIYIGNKDISKIDPDKVLEEISMVFQDVFLFNDTIMNNIRFGRENASDEEVKKAAELAQCKDFINKMPLGFDTVLSEGGKNLSGGERQRISIARAILKDSDIILFDEATASLDPENENVIQKAIENLVKNKTLIVIAHKFNSIINADQIIALKNGEIVEKGTHNELVDQKGYYNSLWQAQKKAGSWKIR